MENYIMPLAGGALIGLSATLLMLSIGKIAGISGIFWGAVQQTALDSQQLWRACFILGLPIGALLAHSILEIPYPAISEAPMQAALAGLLVGVGVKLGNGCTSGHGVCGIGRLSLRSIVATATFTLVAILTVLLVRQRII